MRAMVFAIIGSVLCAAPPTVHAQHEHTAKAAPAMLLPEMGTVVFPVSTTSEEAQQFFNQGLALVYGFNHDEAIRAFRRAAELDPKLAMAFWGIALALGPNINMPMDPAQGQVALEAIRQATTLAPEASAHERAYIEALTIRYPEDPTTFGMEHATAYAAAMKAVMQQYPDDLDAATLYAESLMDLRPWQLWTPDGQPAEGTEEILAVPESVMKRAPQHLGANHYYIHAVEASSQPERALGSAYRLETLAPGAGHLVHMPAHIYIRVGDFESLARVNEKAVIADQEYVEKTGAEGLYPAMYASHNVDFLVTGYSMSGQYEKAKAAALDFDRRVQPVVAQMPMLEYGLTRPASVYLRFQRWDEVLQLPDPGPDRPLLQAFRHYAKGIASAAQGDVNQAEQERAAFGAALPAVSEEVLFGLNPAPNVMRIAEAVLDARVAEARGDLEAAAGHLEKAVQLQDALNYNEPPDWYYPVRESLGGLLIRMGRAEEAEAVFREDLRRNPRNGRSLFGLAESLRMQGKERETRMVQRELEPAWEHADTPLDLDAL